MPATVPGPVDPTALATALAAVPGCADVDRSALRVMPFNGLAHVHVRIGETGLLARVPRGAAPGVDAAAALARQATAFRRAAASGHVPRLAAVLPPGRGLPFGALVVAEVRGRKPRLPDDLPALAAALAAIHRLAVPAAGERPPLPAPEDPLDHLLATIERQAGYLEPAGVPEATRAQIAEDLAWARAFAAARPAPLPPPVLGLTDTHPGNFVVDGAGRAWFVDLEKAMYGLAAVDLAHATLATSTRFDPEVDAVLAPGEVRDFHRAYLDAVDPAAARALRPWIAPVRRMVWLRTMTWCAMWRVRAAAPGAPWAGRDLRADLRDHLRRTLDDYFDPGTARAMRAEWLDRGPEDLF